MNLHKLFTHEDTYSVHKLLGFTSLISYFMCFVVCPLINIDYLQKRDFFSLLIILIHLLLSVSSLIFKLPNKRNKTYTIIWPEFRLHSIIFAYRTLLTMLVCWFDMNKKYEFLLKTIIIYATLFSADYTTNYYKKFLDKDDTTMRGMPFSESVSLTTRDNINYYYSVSQIIATMTTFYTDELFSHYLILFPIQIAAFLMTCVKKSIISTNTWHILYGLSLFFNYLNGIRVVIQYNYMLVNIIFVYSMCYLRFTIRLNKYSLWTIYMLFTIIFYLTFIEKIL